MMPKIPEYQRQAFVSSAGIGADPSLVSRSFNQNIQASTVGFDGTRQLANQIGDILANKRQQQLTAQAGEFTSGLNMQAYDQFNELTKRVDIQKDPSKMRDSVNQMISGMENSSGFTQQPAEVQRVARQQLVSLREKLMGKAIDFENKQMFQNTITSLDRSQTNFELQALDTDIPLNDILVDLSAVTTGAVRSGALSINQGEEHLKNVASSVTANRFQKFVNENDINAAQEFLKEDGVKEYLGADGYQRALNAIAQKQKSMESQAEGQRQLLHKEPWKWARKYYGQKPNDLFENGIIPMQDDIDSRMEYIHGFKMATGVDLPIMDKIEYEMMENYFKTLPSQQVVSVMDSMNSELTDEAIGAIGQVFMDNNPSYAAGLTFSQTDPELANHFINGDRIRENKTQVIPSDNEFTFAMTKRVGDKIAQPEFIGQLTDSAKSAYASMAARDNSTTKTFVSSYMDEILNKSLGKAVNVNGMKTYPFRDQNGEWLTKGQFLNAKDEALVEDNLMKYSGDVPRMVDGTPLNLEDIKRNGRLITISEGQYNINIGDGFFAVDNNGEPYVLDIKQIYMNMPEEEQRMISNEIPISVASIASDTKRVKDTDILGIDATRNKDAAVP